MDEAAFEMLMREHWTTVEGWACRIAGDLDWESLAQDVFVRAWDNRSRLPSHAAPMRVWLYRTLQRATIDALRHRGRRASVPLDEARDSAATIDPADQVTAGETSRRVLDRIEAFDEPTRSVLLLRYALGLDRKEIAAALGLTYEQVKSVIRYRTPQLERVVTEGDAA